MTDRKMNVGFIGLGDQGEPMAVRIAAAGYPLFLWARRPQSLAPFEGTGAVVLASPRALGERCDLVGVCVVTGDDVRQVLEGEDGLLAGMRPGSIVAVHSTVLPSTVVELAALTKERGVELLDAPVSGMRRGAFEGSLTVMVGGPKDVYERALPVFQTFGSKVPLLGPVGAGQQMKLLNNNLCFANMALGLSALEVAEQLGMDRGATADVLLSSSGASYGLKTILAIFAKHGRMVGPAIMEKDHHCFLELLAERGLDGGVLAQMAAVGTDVVCSFGLESP